MHAKNTIFVKIDECLGFPEIEQDIKIWPNPTNGIIYFSDQGEINKLEIIDVSVRSIKINPNGDKIDLGFLMEGIYTLRFFKENKPTGEKRILILK